MSVTLNHWGIDRPIVEEGRLTGMRPAEGDPSPSRISENFVGSVSGPMRITQPMIRKGFLEGDGGAKRGEDSFVAVSWDEANARVAKELREIIAEHGNEAIFGGSYGWASAGRFHHAQSQIHRFLNLLGGYVRSVNTHSHAAAEVVLPHLIGNQDGMADNQTPWELIVGHTELFVAFGGLAVKNAQVSAGGVSQHRVPDQLQRARAAGTRFVNVSPLRDDTPAELDPEWLALRPNTDVALMLALAHVLEAEGRADHAFLDRYTTGYDRFRAYLMGQSDGIAKTPAWAAAITGLAPEVITSLAREMAQKRTMLSMAWSLQRADHGEQPVWMIVTLAAMLGQIGLPGGGFGTGYAAANRVGNISLPFAWPAFPQLKNPVRSFIPVARLGDMLEQPGAAFDYNGARYHYPKIELIWWAGGNPFHHQQDLGRLHRVWKNPRCVIVQEPFWNAIAKHGDIVLPCTLPLERNDLGITKGEPHLVAMKQVVAPFAQSRNDFDILAGIAAAMGMNEDFTGGLDEMGWLNRLYDESREVAAQNGYTLPEFHRFWQDGEFAFTATTPPRALLQAFREDPLAYPLATPSGRIEIFSERVEGFGYADCPGHATWFEPGEWLGNAPQNGWGDALHLISNQPDRKLHSQLDLGSYSREAKIRQREPARINPAEAARRGLVSGQVVRVWSERGACLAGLVISDAIADGVIQMSTGAWLDLSHEGLDRHGNVNVLTRDLPTSSLAQGPTAHTTLVWAEPWLGELPHLEAFSPPEISGTDQLS
ncbi:molybdopterin-dependent oxidoreductase [Rhodobacter sp. 24-YEA-8]|uniref:molybdopterin-dependent oxidoreductase n=1 Tax=Rhodobacter sp. 24-YEA-8 TaxID=1884310 RepID=UPI00089900B7|nr:molybdopterin-dependent oxidoreductase [Rhodobacter sp. 24-YEA-8]SED86699.1 biotin/methionine sulfoxide reductase [Rhodobacter sp. 24-YEA-8]